MLARRTLLLSAASSFASSPGRSLANTGAPSVPASEADCAVSVSRLSRGELVKHDDEGSCGNRSASVNVFQAASLAKPVVATLVLKQVLRGKLGLDQAVSELLPDGYPHRQNLFALREPPRLDHVPADVLRKITVRHLLSHTSGLPNWSAGAPLRPVAEAGKGWIYSGEGYVLLQHILTTRTGTSLNDLATSEIFGPLDLRDTALKLTEHIKPFLVAGRTSSGQIRQLRFPYEIAADSLYTSSSDYARFIAATLADPPLLRLITQSAVAVPGAQGVSWGLGWGLEQSDGGHAIWHWGNNPGFRALAMGDLSSRNAVVVLTASESGMPAAKAIVRRYLQGAHPALEFALVG